MNGRGLKALKSRQVYTKERVDRIREKAKTMTVRQLAESEGVTEGSMRNACTRYDILCKRDSSLDRKKGLANEYQKILCRGWR